MGGSIDSMKDPAGPLWLAASVDNALPDVWGSAYMVALNLSTAARRHQAMAELAANEGGKYFQWGQARSLPAPLYWTRCCWSPDCGCGNFDIILDPLTRTLPLYNLPTCHTPHRQHWLT